MMLNALYTFMTSPYILLWVVLSLASNRALVYAAVHRRVELSVVSRLILRLPPVILQLHALGRFTKKQQHMDRLLCDSSMFWDAYTAVVAGAFIGQLSDVLTRSTLPSAGLGLFEYSLFFYEAEISPTRPTCLMTALLLCSSVLKQLTSLIPSALTLVPTLGYYLYIALSLGPFVFPSILSIAFLPLLLSAFILATCLSINTFSRIFTSSLQISPRRFVFPIDQELSASLLRNGLLALLSTEESGLLRETDPISAAFMTLSHPFETEQMSFADIPKPDMLKRYRPSISLFLQIYRFFKYQVSPNALPMISPIDSDSEFSPDSSDTDSIVSTHPDESEPSLGELFSKPDDLKFLVSEDTSLILRSHLENSKVTTRSKYKSAASKTVTQQDLFSLVSSRISPQKGVSARPCVVCYANDREIILFPCRY
ncbi:hypothetical protein NEOLI_000477 [Neolecta irregularis DAH-3]|uniref:Uncharacterized protein n=1 Tax=Neolecta irregularis (strain DAH-3) TaxID=1198029 RepID=A0A1U7LTS5_NEOID|nr:hypothetical protein NEOLI_000477 [Neolecta irregularis DAH-3]|eukprot:OLL26070.1 hypothetical protein NEOLI_000477 [Neolecta irregularis DAH-3]